MSTPGAVEVCPRTAEPCAWGCVGAWCRERQTFDPPRPEPTYAAARPGLLARLAARVRATVQLRTDGDP